MSILREYIEKTLEASEELMIPPPPEVNYRIAELEVIQNQYYNRYNPESVQGILDNLVDAFNAVLTGAGIRSQKNLRI